MGGVRRHCDAPRHRGRDHHRRFAAGAGLTTPLVALVLVVAAFALPAAKVRQASRVPRIHDITTDTNHPPQFVGIVADARGRRESCRVRRAGDRRATASAGIRILQPLTLPSPPDQAFDKALATARGMGWEIIASDPPSGRIEATDTTFWFGFKDDVVVRVRRRTEREPRRCAVAVARGSQRRRDERGAHPQIPRGAQERVVADLTRGDSCRTKPKSLKAN